MTDSEKTAVNSNIVNAVTTAVNANARGSAATEYNRGADLRRAIDFRQGDSIGKHKDYIIIERLKAGGKTVLSSEADLYLCVRGNDEFVAKIYRREQSVKPEVVKILSLIHSPYIARFCEIGEIDGFTYEIMPYYKNGSLLDKKIEEKDLKRVITQLNEGLNTLHKYGIVHRDLKPPNIMLCDNRTDVALIDFGVSSALGDSTSIHTSTGTTYLYQAFDTATVHEFSPSTDYYSLGTTIFHLYANQKPWHDIPNNEINSYKNRGVLPMKGFPEDLKRLIKGLIYPNKHRFGYAQVKDWLDGKNPPLPEEIFERGAIEKAVKPYHFIDTFYSDISRLIEAMSFDWEEGKFQLEYDTLGTYFKENGYLSFYNNYNLYRTMYRNAKLAKDKDGIFAEFLFKLESNNPRLLWKGREYADLDALGREILSAAKIYDYQELLYHQVLSRYAKIKLSGNIAAQSSLEAFEKLYRRGMSDKELKLLLFNVGYMIREHNGKGFSLADRFKEKLCRLRLKTEIKNRESQAKRQSDKAKRSAKKAQNIDKRNERRAERRTDAEERRRERTQRALAGRRERENNSANLPEKVPFVLTRWWGEIMSGCWMIALIIPVIGAAALLLLPVFIFADLIALIIPIRDSRTVAIVVTVATVFSGSLILIIMQAGSADKFFPQPFAEMFGKTEAGEPEEETVSDQAVAFPEDPVYNLPEGAELLKDLPYKSSSRGNEPAFEYFDFVMDNFGTEYANGISGTSGDISWHDYDVSNYSALRGRIVLNYNYRTQKDDETLLSVFADGELVYSCFVSAGFLPEDFEVDLEGVSALHIEISGRNLIRLTDCVLVANKSVESVSTAREPASSRKPELMLSDFSWFNSSDSDSGMLLYDYVKDNTGTKVYGNGIGGRHSGENFADLYVDKKFAGVKGKIVLNYDYRDSDNKETYFSLYADGGENPNELYLIYQSPVVNSGFSTTEFDVDISDVTYLRVQINGSNNIRLVDCVLYGGNERTAGYGGDYAEVSPNGVYYISSASLPNRVIEVENANAENRANIALWGKSGEACQRFKAVRNAEGLYTFFDQNSGKVIDVMDGRGDDEQPVWLWEHNGREAQVWRLVEAGGGYYYIRSVLGENLVLEATEQGNVQIGKFKGTDNQKWRFTEE